MSFPTIDKEFMHYWSKLAPEQKQSLLCLAKSFAEAREATVEKKDSETGASLHSTADRKYLTQEEIEEEAEKWWRKCTGYYGQL